MKRRVAKKKRDLLQRERTKQEKFRMREKIHDLIAWKKVSRHEVLFAERENRELRETLSVMNKQNAQLAAMLQQSMENLKMFMLRHGYPPIQ